MTKFSKIIRHNFRFSKVYMKELTFWPDIYSLYICRTRVWEK